MQSYLQYRRIGQAVRAQVARGDQEKASAPTTLQSSGRSSPLQTAYVAAEPEQAVEVEKELAPVEPSETVLSEAAAFGHSLEGVHVRQRTDAEGGSGKVFVVGWESPTDPLNPRNFSFRRKVVTTLIVSLIAFLVGAESSVDSAVAAEAAAEYGVSDVTESLATGLYLIGYGVGALLSGPFSELFGRNMIYMVTMVVFMIFVMASALAPNIGAQLAFRFLAGMFGSTPLTCAGGTVADLWSPLEKTYGFPLYAIPCFAGPMLGPVICSYIGTGHIGSWHWVEWIMLIFTALTLTIVLLFQPETYAPLLLKWKAHHLRTAVGDDRYRADMEIIKTPLLTRMKIALSRPFFLTIHEPIVMLISLYMGVVYIVLFTFFDGYTFVFAEVYGTSEGVTNLCFLAMAMGNFSGVIMVPFVYSKTKKVFEKAAAEGRTEVQPEVRLWYAMLGASFAIPISLLWMGWTDYASISIWSPLLASALFGYGIIGIFLSAYMYIIDVYEVYAASALTFLTVFRYWLSGGLTVVGIPFYKNMGPHWTCTILACISMLLTPLPFAFYKYGHRIRQFSKFSMNRS
ncbi:major facilitator superfamily domain-containing protein [Dipodascopsis tothii]|uniref:major facilitator superfamily domain-containing protein n=1 Tax=Dipodascopsis tothii TaxID=44089 RepID=UPI0034CF585F